LVAGRRDLRRPRRPIQHLILLRTRPDYRPGKRLKQRAPA